MYSTFFSIHKHIMAISNVQFEIAKQIIKDLGMIDIIQFRRKKQTIWFM